MLRKLSCMPRLQREHLETLLAAVDHGTLDAAARVLAITPSAVSQRIKSMEQQLGRVLLQRTTPVRPTPDGEVVLRHARQAQLLDEETARALGGGDSVVPSIPLAVNADSLGTWFLDALALVRADTEVVFDLHREDQDRTAELLRAGTVMGAVTAEADPVQGCSSVPLGIDRYRAVASPAFVDRYLGAAAGAGSERRLLDRMDRVPLVDYDRADDLQQGYLRRVLGHAPSGPRHFVPTSADFARAVSLGFGWGMLPEAQCLDALDRGDLVELTPGRRADVALWWQRWNLASPLLERVTDAVRATAAERLHPVRQALAR